MIGIQSQPPFDPLAELRDIHMPPSPAFWPPAPGWWWLAVVGIALLILAALYLHSRWRRARPRRAALRALDALRARYAGGEPASALVAEVAILLRRVALSQRPREEVAGLTGRAWLEFLDGSAGERGFRDGPGRCLTTAPYRPSEVVDMDALLSLSEDWVKRNA